MAGNFFLTQMWNNSCVDLFVSSVDGGQRTVDSFILLPQKYFLVHKT